MKTKTADRLGEFRRVRAERSQKKEVRPLFIWVGVGGALLIVAVMLVMIFGDSAAKKSGRDARESMQQAFNKEPKPSTVPTICQNRMSEIEKLYGRGGRWERILPARGGAIYIYTADVVAPNNVKMVGHFQFLYYADGTINAVSNLPEGTYQMMLAQGTREQL